MSNQDLNDSDDFEDEDLDEGLDAGLNDEHDEFSEADFDDGLPEIEVAEPHEEVEANDFDETSISDGFDGLDSDIDADSMDMRADDELEKELSSIDGADHAEDEATEDPSFLSTPNGRIVLGGSAFAFVVAGIGGFFLFGSGQPAPVAIQAQSSEWGTVVAQNAESASQFSPQEGDVELLAPIEMVEEIASTAVAVSSTWQPEPVQPIALTPVTTYTAPPALAASAPQTIDLGSFKEEILEAIRAEIPSLIPAPSTQPDNNSDLATVVESLRREVTDLRQEKEEMTASLNDDDPRNGLSRLKGFHVTNATDDGTMSIVETPSGRVNVYFEGEKFNVDGKSHRVTGIVDGGRVVLVDNNFYIDEVREARPASQARAPAPVRERSAPVEDRVTVTTQPYYETPNSQQEPLSAERNVVMTPRSAPGWNLNANMNQGFLVKNPRGEFKMVRQGDVLDGLGVVDGLDSNGFLRVGIYKIARE